MNTIYDRFSIVDLMFNIIISLINTLGVYCWIILYTEKEYREWWIYLFILICSVAAFSGYVGIYRNLKFHFIMTMNKIKEYRDIKSRDI